MKKTDTSFTVIDLLIQHKVRVMETRDMLLIDFGKMKLLNELVENFKRYAIPPYEVSVLDLSKVTFTNRTLYHHAMWTVHTLENWFSENNFWEKDIDPKDKNLTILVGFCMAPGLTGQKP